MKLIQPLLVHGLGLVALTFSAAACSRTNAASESTAAADLTNDSGAHRVPCALTRPAAALQNKTVTAICDDVYAENGLDARELTELRSAYEQASANLLNFFESTRASPLVVFCRSAPCKIAFGAPPSAAASEDLGFASAQILFEDGTIAPSSVVATGPVEGTTRILTHELVHAEMKAWVTYDSLPTWFNEGTATYLASEPRCDEIPSPSVEPNVVTSLTTKAKWQRHLQATRKTRDTYCAARREVEKWMARFETDHLKAEALKTLMHAVAQGTPFDSAFRAGE